MEKLEIVLSVSEFNEVVNRHLGLLGEVTVEGEIVQLRVSQGKWVFATIKDVGASVEVFGIAYQITNLRALEEGMKVKVCGVPRLYQKSGRFSIQASSIVPSGEGALAAAYEKLKLVLTNEGLFDEERKRELPMFPERIGLITAKGSEAYNDFVKVMAERMGGMKILFYPVQVQGKEAVSSIKRAVEFFSEHKKVEVVVVTRGGGSMEDLAAFNDEVVVRAIFGSRIPVVCGVGHEGDISLAELAADMRASTPTNAAMLVCRDRREVRGRVDQMAEQIEVAFRQKMMVNENKIEQAVDRLEIEIGRAMNSLSESISRFEMQLRSVSERIVQVKLNSKRLMQRVISKMEIGVSDRRTQVEGLERLLLSLDYHRVLERGYSITFDEQGKPVKDLTKLMVGDGLVTQVRVGKIRSKISRIDISS